MFAKFKQRSYELEHLDKGDYTRDEYDTCIVELQRVNRYLGDIRTLRKSALNLVEHEKLERFTVLDVGAGSGELLRSAAIWSRDRGKSFCGVGIELNEQSAQAIAKESKVFKNIYGVRGDAFRLPFMDDQFDFVICSLFTHHFVENDIVSILREMARVACRNIFVIDLHRHPVAYYFYTTIAKIFLHNRLIREDGALSILRGFKSWELREIAGRAGLHEVSVDRVFPYRLVMTAAAEPNRASRQHQRYGNHKAA
ncbi:MAG: methyltransferase domain-containing protein [Pyrinomonadaceae bacterium]